MTRATSAQAYREIQESKLISCRQWQVYDVLYRCGPLTANEALERIALETPEQARAIRLSSTRTRFTELRRLGLLREAGERKCTTSGKRAIVWECVKDALPVKEPRRKRIAWPQLADRYARIAMLAIGRLAVFSAEGAAPLLDQWHRAGRDE